MKLKNMITGKYPSLRLRRTRKYNWSRKLIQENNLSPNDLIYPIFLIEGKNRKQPIKSMPGVYRYSIDQLGMIINNIIKHKIPMVALFPSTPKNKKDRFGTEALNENNLVCRAIRFIKKRFKNNIGIMSDVALDPYTTHGHDGLLKNNYVINDETIGVLVKQSLLQAQMGCDVISPSDMMDGRIGKIRKLLDKNKYKDVQILSYAVKYASNFYGPFRDAVGSKKSLKSDKKNYQMDFSNSNEALREVALDIKEGADMVMVKPGMPYLDIIQKVKENFKIPVLAYQVSGEYSIIKNGIKNKLINEDAIIESLMCFKRAGASAIVSYFALEIAKKLNIN
jgi:porphobilinogen synthase